MKKTLNGPQRKFTLSGEDEVLFPFWSRPRCFSWKGKGSETLRLQ